MISDESGSNRGRRWTKKEKHLQKSFDVNLAGDILSIGEESW